MDIATAIATLNRLLTSKEPAQFNSSWIRRHAPRCYRFIRVNFRREYGGIDWDRLTCALERRFQRLWKPERITKRSLYEEPREIDAIREKFHRSEEHTSELQSQSNLVCRLLLEKKIVARGSSEAGRTPVDYRMADFFVSRTFRRRVIGKLAVELILNRFAGRWEITEYLRNPVAVSFWRRVVANYTKGRYQERVTNGEVRQIFESGPARDQKPDNFFFNDTATTEIYTLSLHDALPI